MPDGGDKPRKPVAPDEAAAEACDSDDKPIGNSIEVASMVLQSLHRLKDISKDDPIAIMAVNHLSRDQSFFDLVAAEFNADPINFRRFRRNVILQELGRDITDNRKTEIAMLLNRELANCLSRHPELATNYETAVNPHPPGSRQHQLFEAIQANNGRILRWRMIYEILQLKL